MVTEIDIEFMRMAMEAAARGAGFVHPNPYVGAVIVKEGRIIGKGWHERFGGLHAERNALASLSGSAEGATLYVTLEPCCHYGKTPPCTEAILESGISRVVVGLKDPNPLVAGKGIRILQDAGIEVECGVLEKELAYQNRAFLKYITAKLPWVTLKTAMSLDGKIATSTGDSKWISSVESREYSQHMRGQYSAIMVGINTVVADDPMLDCRLSGPCHQPVRIIVDSHASIALDTRIVRTAKDHRTIVVHTVDVPDGKLDALHACQVETMECRTEEGRVSVTGMLSGLAACGIDSIILEGGGTLNDSFIRSGNVDEVYAFIAPMIIGGKEARGAVSGSGVQKLSEAAAMEIYSVDRCGADVLIRGLINKR